MAMAQCRECGKQVSTEATTCPQCGVPRPTESRVTVPPSQPATHSPFRNPPAPRPAQAAVDVSARCFCRTCGKPVREEAEICPSCGTRPLLGRAFCQSCGGSTAQNQEVCVKCGMRLKTLLAADHRGLPIQSDFPGLPEYYRTEFKKIYESNESYKGKWNFAAFLFGPLWALTKGIWLAPVICIVAAILTWGIAGIAYWFIFGARGNYMYYSAHARQKQVAI